MTDSERIGAGVGVACPNCGKVDCPLHWNVMCRGCGHTWLSADPFREACPKCEPPAILHLTPEEQGVFYKALRSSTKLKSRGLRK